MSTMFKLDPNAKFDDETIELYRLRETSEEKQLIMHRPDRGASRGYLPVYTKLSKTNEQNLLPIFERHPYLWAAGIVYSTWAAIQWCKAFFPYGYVLRSSIPQSWTTYLKLRAPVVTLMIGVWYATRYTRIKSIPDLTCDSETD